MKKRRDYELGKYMYTVLYSTKTLQDTRMKLIGIDKWTNVVKICMNPTQIHCKDCLLLSRTLEWYCNILRFTKNIYSTLAQVLRFYLQSHATIWKVKSKAPIIILNQSIRVCIYVANIMSDGGLASGIIEPPSGGIVEAKLI